MVAFDVTRPIAAMLPALAADCCNCRVGTAIAIYDSAADALEFEFRARNSIGRDRGKRMIS